MMSLVIVCLLTISTTLGIAISPAQIILKHPTSYELPSDVAHKGILSPEFYHHIELAREKYGIKGVSMVIVHADADPEYGS
jgi:hypothetical protein